MIDLEKKLAQYSVPAYSPLARQQTITQAKRALQYTAKKSTVTGRQFCLTQVCFIRKQMWAAQLAFLAGIYLLISILHWQAGMERYVFPLLSIAMPLVILINITDFARFYNTGMLEIEMATKFSLQKVAAAKLIIFGVSDGALLLTVAAFAAQITQTRLFFMLLYGLVPFNIMCLGCFVLLIKGSVAHFSFAAVMLAAGLTAVMLIINTNGILYTAALHGAWVVAFLATFLAMCWQLVRFLQQLSRADALCL